MTPDVWLILLSTLFALAGYLLWLRERLPRFRALHGVLALLAFVLSFVFHDVIAPRRATSAANDGDARTHQPQPARHAATS